MQDDNPWKPPADAGSETAAPSVPPTGADAGSVAPSLPPTGPSADSVAPSLPPSSPGPLLPPSQPAVAPPPPVPPAATVPGDQQWAAAAPSAVGAPAPSETVIVSSGEPPSRSRRSKWLVGGALVAVVATGAAGAFAFSNLTGSVQGGAASPEELGLTLLEAIENEDVLGVVDVLSPGERDVFRDPLVDLVSELTRLEVLSADADLSRILGVDVQLSNESVSSTSTNVPDITNIDLRADAVLTFDGAEVPIGDLITDNVPDELLTEMRGTRVTETDELDVRLTAIEDDGRWYFSVFHSIAEAARAEMAPGSLIPVQGIGANGAASPTEAFDGLLDQVERLDLAGMLRTLNPGEASALQRYSPLFLEEAESALAELPLEWEISRREFRVDETGDTATVFVDAIAIDGMIEGEAFSVELADDCIKASAAGETFEQCNDAAFDDVTDMFDDAPETKRLIDTFTEAFSDMQEVGLEMRRTDELWYVSPTTTVTEGFLAVLRALDRSELDAIIEQVPPVIDEFTDAIFDGINGLPGTFGGIDESTIVTDDAIAEPAITEPVTDEPADESIVLDDFASEGSWEDCYSELDPELALVCFDASVTAGEIDASQVPLVLRYPECGYVASWGGGIYSLSDEEFTAAAEAAQPCFLDLVERGEVSDFELPPEIGNLECFEGRNWYNVFDDPDFDDRYYTCLEAAFGE